ncbi:S8 family peptidase [Nitratidesulfovibrio sp. HK-II]|uniref:S8 family peptidase n=1 Tax=Nitratidesulfovibrio oxamicus TaxID=32016 RepID=A0ABS0J8L3_9BACT|nr:MULTISPECIES: S8 family peptidase [Nitratidesulfovibrio]MBG3878472.1 S8 family peptidase [Nitratidesulfovibrio oxamicus]GBO96905.1 hypothetical protein RVX_1944 [Nitratidesulfovibrio sp. HK-II]GBO98213.1 subtilisin-like serine proteases [Nitratidesulfovibrio sp. HK-II]
MNQDKLPILAKGEQLAREVPYQGGFNDKDAVWTYEEAKSRLLPQLEATTLAAEAIPQNKRIKSGVFFAVDLDCNYIAKSYYPKQFFDKAQWELHGSIGITQTERNNRIFADPKTSRRLFFKATPEALKKSLIALKDDAFTTDQERKSIQRIYNIRMHEPAEKLININTDSPSILELIIHPLETDDWNTLLGILQEELTDKTYPMELFKWDMGARLGGPRFLPIRASKQIALALATLNPIRSIRPMPRVSFPRFSSSGKIAGPEIVKPIGIRAADLPYIGVFDGGVDTTIPQLGPWVTQEEITPQPATYESIAHGTAVCGAVLYGDKPQLATTPPAFRAKSFRVLPPPNPTSIPELDLYALVEAIEQTVRSDENQNIKTYVLSFGPDQPIEDKEIDYFTSTLDRLAFELDVLFVVAAGNAGEAASPWNRIQPPADIVNGLGIGAFVHTPDKKPVKTPYSCPGPGRSGNCVKPDLHMFGGDDKQPFTVFLAGDAGGCTATQGTSFAAPLACNLASHLLYRVDDYSTLTPQTAKALMIHKAITHDAWKPNWGWGALDYDITELTTCSKNKVTILYNGDLPIGRRTVLPIPLPSDTIGKKTIQLSWTVVYATDIAPSMPDEYTLGGADVKFRPHCDIYTYTVDKQPYTVNRELEAERFKALVESNVIGEHKLPKPESVNSKKFYLTEAERRKFGVWDTTKHYWTKFKHSRTLKDPMLDIHAQARSDWQYDKFRPRHIKYACVVTIETRAPIDIYSAIQAKIPALVPVQLRSTARVRV